MNTQRAAMRVASICIRVAVFVLVCLGIVYLGQTTYHYTHAVFSDEALEDEPGRTVKLNVPKDISAKELSEILEKNGVIKDAGIFHIQMKMADFGDTVKAGAYELNTSMTPTEIFKILSEINEDES